MHMLDGRWKVQAPRLQIRHHTTTQVEGHHPVKHLPSAAGAPCRCRAGAAQKQEAVIRAFASWLRLDTRPVPPHDCAHLIQAIPLACRLSTVSLRGGRVALEQGVGRLAVMHANAQRCSAGRTCR